MAMGISLPINPNGPETDQRLGASSQAVLPGSPPPLPLLCSPGCSSLHTSSLCKPVSLKLTDSPGTLNFPNKPFLPPAEWVSLVVSLGSCSHLVNTSLCSEYPLEGSQGSSWVLFLPAKGLWSPRGFSSGARCILALCQSLYHYQGALTLRPGLPPWSLSSRKIL